MNGVRRTSQVSISGKNVAIFSDTINLMNAKFCVMVVLTERYSFIPLLVTLSVFQGHSSVKYFYLKILCSSPIKLKFCTIVDYVKYIMNIPLLFLFSFFIFCTCAGEIIDVFSH